MLETAAAAVLTNVPAAISSTPLVPANRARKGLLLFNDSSATVWIAYDSVASTTHYTVQLAANSPWTMPTPPVYVGPLSAIWSSAVGALRVTEL